MEPPDCGKLYRDGRHYDGQIGGFVADIPFYLSQVEKYGTPVLELACGTGRVTIPLAENGIDITGLDVSRPMLDVAREKSTSAGLNVNWGEEDCREFKLGEKFNLIFFPINSITHLHDRESFEACFSCVREHLSAEGRFIIDLFNPRLDLLMRDPDKRYPVAEYPDPGGEGSVTVTENNVYDSVNQINRLKWYYRIGDQERIVENNMRIIFPKELDALLHYNGFDIEAKYGNYDQSLFASDSPKQITVCRLK